MGILQRCVGCSASLLVISLAAGCSGNDGAGGGSTECPALGASDLAAFEGIYSLTAYTRNEAACDVEGASVLEGQTETMLFIGRTSFLGRTSLLLQSCTTADDCRTKHERATGGGLGAGSAILFQFSCSGGDGSAFSNMRSTGMTGTDGMCTDPQLSADRLSKQDGGIVVESLITHGDDYPADSEGFCTTDAGYAATKDKPCSEFELLRASFVEAL